jgi:ABC-type Na+ efflux pump permease subunit
MVSKPEDVASTQLVFQLPVMISWLASYFAPLTGKSGLLAAARYIPFTAPFSVPADLITGAMGLAEGMISLASLMIFSLLTVILAARIYKGLVLYNGQRLGFKIIGNILKSDRIKA